MKEIVKKIIAFIFGNDGFSKIDTYLKIIRVYGNRILSASEKITLYAGIKNDNYTCFKSDGYEIFFGYYDHSPISDDGRLCLALRIDTRKISKFSKVMWFSKVTMFNKDKLKGVKASVGYFDLVDPDAPFHEIGETLAWCWQQGARLRWAPGLKNSIIYNTVKDGRYCAVVQDISGSIVTYFNQPIYDLNVSGSKALSLNFSRLQRMRPGYGYDYIEDETSRTDCPDNDGVWVYDTKSSESILLFSLKFLASVQSELSMEGAEHYINHLSWSVTGKNFLFFHIWKKNGKRHTRVFTSSEDGVGLRVLIAGSASHYCWLSDVDVIVVKSENSSLSYNQYNIKTGECSSLSSWMPGEDGHPSVVSSRYIITDNYPDKYGRQYLFLCDSEREEITTLGRFYSSPLTQGEIRCDLHPRYHKKSNTVCFDSNFSGQRSINILKLHDIILGD